MVSPDGARVAFGVGKAVMEGEKSEWLYHIHIARSDGSVKWSLPEAAPWHQGAKLQLEAMKGNLMVREVDSNRGNVARGSPYSGKG